jgi:hypothetical protein
METGVVQIDEAGDDAQSPYVPAMTAERTTRPASVTSRARKIRCTFMIDVDLAKELRAVNERTGMSDAEQVRRGIRLWLESIRWPARPARAARSR